MRGYTLLRNVTSPAGDSNAVPYLDLPRFHRRTLSGQGAFRPLTPDTNAFRPCETLTKGQRPLEPANQSRAVPGTLAQPSAGWMLAKGCHPWNGPSGTPPLIPLPV